MSSAGHTFDLLREAAEGPRAFGATRERLLREVEEGLFERVAEPVTYGRYVVRERLGAGAQGTVYAADDPALGRRVALKLVRGGTSDDAPTHDRLLREALALARLSHPNVLSINDIGRCADGLFLVTELVPGRTLAEWLSRFRPWRDALEVMIGVGRGLAAVHDHGLLHRDVKPANILIGRDGRPRIADFGLATLHEVEHGTSVSSLASGGLTRTGFVMGTPAYMAPEQHAGAPATAQSDQYAFCVTLYEALVGRRPFVGATVAELAENKARGGPDPLPRTVPRRLRRAVLRGIDRDPARRFASMRELLRALGSPTPGASAWTFALAGIGAVLLFARADALQADPPACDPNAQWRGVWDDARRVELERAFVATGLPYAPNAATRAADLFDRHRDRWIGAWQEACVGGDAVALECLERRRIDTDRLLTRLAEADDASVEGSARLDAALPDPRDCTGEGEARGGDTAALDPELADALVEWRLGHLEAALAALETLDGDGPQAPTIALARGRILAETGRHDAAAAVLEAGYHEASRRGDAGPAAEAAIELVALHGAERHDDAQAEAWLRHAEATIERLDDPRRRRRLEGLLAHEHGRWLGAGAEPAAELKAQQRALRLLEPLDAGDELAGIWSRLGVALVRAQRYDDAADAHARALEVATEAYGPDHPALAQLHSARAALLTEVDRYEDAVEARRSSAALLRRALGPSSPRLGREESHIAGLLTMLGRNEEAEAVARRAAELLADDDDAAGRAWHYVALACNGQGRPEEAIGADRRALDLLEGVLGPEHPDLAPVLSILGWSLAESGRREEALAVQLRLVELSERAYGAADPAVAEARLSLGYAQGAVQDFDAAAETFARAREGFSAAFGETHSMVGYVDLYLGKIAALRGEHGDAIAKLQRSHDVIVAALGAEHPNALAALGALVAAHVGAGRRDRARVVLEAARANTEASGAVPEAIDALRLRLRGSGPIELAW